MQQNTKAQNHMQESLGGATPANDHRRGNAERCARRGLQWTLGALALGALAVIGLTACTDAKPGTPALPAGFEAQGVPEVDLNAFVYFNNEEPISFPVEAVGQVAGTQVTIQTEAKVRTVQGAMREPERELGARIEFTDPTVAQFAADRIEQAVGSEPNLWVEAQGSSTAVGRSAGPWGSDLRAAWNDGRYAPINSRYPAAWDMIRFLPSDPPSKVVAAGFARNVSDLLEGVLASSDIGVPGLGSALGLVRVNALAFGMYADGLDSLPSTVTKDTINDLDLGVIAVTKAGYPGFVINFMLGQFASRAQLEPATVDGVDVRYRLVEGQLHLMMRNYGSTLFIAAAPTREGVEDLMRAVIKDQQA